MTEAPDRTYVYTTYIRSTPEQVFRALTTPEFTMQYWGGAELTSDWQVGSPLEAVHPNRDDFIGRILAVEPPHRLSYTFTGRAEEAAGRPPTVVEFGISAFGEEAVKLQVTHTGFTPDEQGTQDMRDVGEGWPAILAALKTLLETERPLASPGHFAPRVPARS
ncbi:Transcriptional regulator, ArsR family [Pseudonocardia sp. Ae168_Ps1]|uniref:SRPBCC family protein n=1 Tax=unclassified Pseudonocardia TaxID=2619320 RepID=UPI00094AF537|nr:MULTISPECIES: SRPBCC family protein [unclassified Pseudonocardia]OLL74797.1 Transcriptional regulator, ArsR family [Pseudonocardia sp. Ae150A_Ps1]OLL80789.1 Transcriptional regulator, ArsR family [Pseudonocardia sp. Ae168_Ps1]OLL85093.1 Transcriptional regulator, ArsR family [Pseudonocardia sp. Ae263_Ps1]OLL94890.1 Transcriptional regulator, ArsR family [Pseudonocardia sp. Ae356_Ps1]